MNAEIEQTDPAAVFACATSLWHACHQFADTEKHLNLSTCFNGIDELMRVVMRVATRFENWATLHVAFEELTGVWPYDMEERFGPACLEVIFPDGLAKFDDTDCLRVALNLRLPIKYDASLPLPVDERAPNPAPNSRFPAFRIRTMRLSHNDTDPEELSTGDDPFDAEFDPPYFSLFGIEPDGSHKHIADRKTYADAVNLARKLAPGIAFPDTPRLTFVS